MSYFEKKAFLAKELGVLKAQRVVTSQLNNKVDDEGVINKAGRGVRNDSILERAKEMEQLEADDKEQNKNSHSLTGKRKKYSLESIIPESLMLRLPYKEVYNALSLEDEDESE